MSSIGKLFGISWDADDEAIEKLKQQLDKDHKSIAFVQLAELYRKKKLYDEAIVVCLRGLTYHSTYVSAYLVLGKCYRDVGDIAKATQIYERIIELSPDNLKGHLILSELYEQTARWLEAKEHLSQAIHLGADISKYHTRFKRYAFEIEREKNWLASNKDEQEESSKKIDLLSLKVREKQVALRKYAEAFGVHINLESL